MLRARPIVTTPRLRDMQNLLETLGLVVAEANTDGDRAWVVLDAGNGRVTLSSTAACEGSIAFGVEIRDRDEFARRTIEAGGAAILDDREAGPTVRIDGRDGFSFCADPTLHGATCADADPRLTVRMVWLTPDVEGAATTLAAMGARPRQAVDVGETHEPPTRGPADSPESVEFVAKNGGVLVVAHAGVVGYGGLAFEYDGDLVPLADRLAVTGAQVSTTARGLTVAAPDGGTFAVMGAHPMRWGSPMR